MKGCITMKKQFIAIAVISMLACFTGCGNDSSSSSSKEAASVTSASTTAETSETAEATTEEKTTSQKETEPETKAETSEDEKYSVADIAGNWYYQKREESTVSDYVGIDVGYVKISSDGTFVYEGKDSTAISGNIRIRYDEFGDGSKIPFFAFYKDNGEMWIGCYCAQNDPDIYYEGNGGEYRLVRDNGSASGGTDNTAVPNEYGFYEYKDAPREGAASIMASDIEGRWIHGQFMLTVTDCDMYSGKFRDENESGEFYGSVKLEYTLVEDNSKQLWYNLYTDDGKLFKSFKATGDIPLNIIKDESEYGIEHERIISEES